MGDRSNTGLRVWRPRRVTAPPKPPPPLPWLPKPPPAIESVRADEGSFPLPPYHPLSWNCLEPTAEDPEDG